MSISLERLFGLEKQARDNMDNAIAELRANLSHEADPYLDRLIRWQKHVEALTIARAGAVARAARRGASVKKVAEKKAAEDAARCNGALGRLRGLLKR